MNQAGINRRLFLKTSGLITLGLGLGVGTLLMRRGRTSPNVVLIMADDMGYECLGSYGGTSYQTPHLDRLAAGGMRFEHCYSQPLCTPSRVQIMTGMYNVRNYERFNTLSTDQTTFGNLFRDNGYATCIAGKWQLTPTGAGRKESPELFGFDEYCLMGYNLGGNKSPELRYRNPAIITNGKKKRYANNAYGPDIVSDYLCDFMERHKKRPFLAYYPMILPHSPFVPTPDTGPVYFGDETPEEKQEYFVDLVSYCDKLVGKIIGNLDKLGLRENTLVLVTADNGTSRKITSLINGVPLTGGKGQPTDAGTHVPMIASWPGVIAPGSVSSELVDFSDFLPTMCDCAGITIPENLSIDGLSLLPVLRGQSQTHREWVYSWYQTLSGYAHHGEIIIYARTRRYKLYGDGQFFDLANDILEHTPLADSRLDAATKQTKHALQQVLDHYQAVDRESDRGLREE